VARATGFESEALIRYGVVGSLLRELGDLHVAALLRELDPDELGRTRGALPAPRSFAGLVRRRLTAATPIRGGWWPRRRSS
jgi:hypothetical protein